MASKQEQAIHERLREARKASGLSQGQVAIKLDLHRPTVTEIEAGRRKVTSEDIKRFAELYGVSSEWIVNGAATDHENDARIAIAARELSKMSEKDLDRLMKLLQMIRKGAS